MSAQAGIMRCGVDGVVPVYTRVEALGADFGSVFRAGFGIRIVSEDAERLVFDMVGVDAPLANALRRILLSEVPSVAFEHVYLFKNTSIIQDEVLCHRIGLIPLNIDPRLMETSKPGDEPTDLNTVVFRLYAAGESNVRPAADIATLEGEDDVEGRYTKVYSSAFTWDPQGTQTERFPEPAAPVHPDILLAKLAPGQVIDLEAHAVKGIGKDHAKFSPVCTAAYRLLPRITLSEERPFLNEEAEALKAACPLNVFDIEDIGKGNKRATVARPRDCTACRECIRPPAWTSRVTLDRVTDHYIFSIESTGAMAPRVIFQEAIKILIEKCQSVLDGFEASLQSESQGMLDAAEAAKVTIAAMKTEPDDLS